MIARLILCSILVGLNVASPSRAEAPDERDEIKLQAAFDTIFDENPNTVLNASQTLEQLKVVEKLVTVELASEADKTDDDMLKTLDLIKTMIKFGQASNKRCLSKESLREYLDVINAYLVPSLWTLEIDDEVGSNGYRYVRHSKAVQNQLCRNDFWSKMKQQIDSFEPAERQKYERLAENLAKYRFESDQQRLVKASVDYFESTAQLPKTKWALKWASEKKNFEDAYKNEVVQLCLDYEKRMRTLIGEYNHALKDELMINDKSYHWIQLGHYCSAIALNPLEFTELAYQEALGRRAYVGVQVPPPTRQPFNEFR